MTEPAIWEGCPQTLTSRATAGRVQGTRYRLTPSALFIDRGLVRTDSQQYPLVRVFDVDVRQGIAQKARGIGDVTVTTDRETLTLESIPDPKGFRDLLNHAVGVAKSRLRPGVPPPYPWPEG